MNIQDFLSAFEHQAPLLACWVAYALFHSLTASHLCKNWVKWRWPTIFASYRLLYNGLAVLLLVPIAWLAFRFPGPMLIVWTGVLFWLLNGLAALSVLAFLRNGSGYDLQVFLGLRPESCESTPKLVISGWHRFVRHPWYSLGLVLLWTRDMSAASLISTLAITVYFVVGSRLEERKLLVEFGERYREYQRRVPGLLPRPWRRLSKADAARLAG